ncbi:MAG: MFS transporter [Spirochaetia bacterium]|nr:MFS transporter [Spirochaetia bacterium]
MADNLMNKQLARKTVLVFSLVFITLMIVLFLNRMSLTLSPWNNTVSIEFPTYAIGNGERIIIVENSEKSVLILNSDRKLIKKLRGKRNSKELFSDAKFVDIDEYNNLYILDVSFGGAFGENVERVLKYSAKGVFLEELYTYRYINEDFILAKGKIAGMTYSGGKVYLIRMERDYFVLERVMAETASEPEELFSYTYPNAFRDLIYFDINPESTYLVGTTSAGGIKQYSFAGTQIYEMRPAGNCLPWTVVFDKNNNLIYTDILNSKIMFINTGSGEQYLLAALDEGSFYKRINRGKEKIFAASYDNIFILNETGEQTILDSYSFSISNTIIRFVLFALFIMTVLVFIGLAVSLVILFHGIKTSEKFRQIALAAFCVALGAVISSILIINEMNDRYYKQTYHELENISRLTVAGIDADILASLSVPGDYETEGYTRLKDSLTSNLSLLPFKGQAVYQIIWMEQDGIVYSMYDLESSSGIFHPFASYEGSIYQEAVDSKEYMHISDVSSEGSWIYTCGPIFDREGNVVALIETGYDSSIFQEQTRSMIIQTILIVVSSAIAFLLLVIECILILEAYNLNKLEAIQKNPVPYKQEGSDRQSMLAKERRSLHFGKRLVSLPNHSNRLSNHRHRSNAATYFVNHFQQEQLRQIIELLTNVMKKMPPSFNANVLQIITNSLIKTYNKNIQQKEKQDELPFRPELLRALLFFLFVANNLAAAILPMYAANLYTPLFNLPRELVITLPFLADMGCAALALLVIPNILERMGIKQIGLIGVILIVAGNVLCFIAQNTAWLTIAYALTGFAGGTMLLVINTIIGAQKEIKDVNSGFAHFNASYLAGVNVGVVLGSIMAQFFSYRIVYLFSIMTALILLAVFLFSVRSPLVNYIYAIQYVKPVKGKKFVMLKFIFKPIVLATLFLAAMPYMLSLSFTSYFMPLYGIEHGLTESNIGQLILLSGLFAILFGTSLCEYMLQKCPVKLVIVGSLLLNLGAIYLFSLYFSLFMLIVAVVLLSIANIFALTNIQTYYASLYQEADVSSMKALSVYSAVENISMGIGPLAFSYIMANNTVMGMKLFAGALLVCLLFFMLVSTVSQKVMKKPGG